MDHPAVTVDRARKAYTHRDWPSAHELFMAARERDQLAADDLAAFADTAWWLGQVDESIATYELAFRAYLDEGRQDDAAMTALGVAVNHLLRGDDTLGSGWIGRSRRILADLPEGPVHGYLLYMTEVEGGLDGGNLGGVIAGARRVGDIGRRFGDRTLIAAALLGEGRALAKMGQVADGMAMLDEAMLGVLSGEVAPDWAGNLYCQMMAACHELADVRRLAHWMDATTAWLATLPAAVLFAGICRVHRSQVLLVRGDWATSETEAARVTDDLVDISVASAAEAHYQLGELRRLRGDHAGSEAAYRRAHERGRDPQPGLALLRLAEGRTKSAAMSIAAALAAHPAQPLTRFRLRMAQLEIARESRDVGIMREAADEVVAIAATYRTSGIEADARRATGLLCLVNGRPAEALPALTDACRSWQAIGAPFEVATIRLALAQAYRALGDEDATAIELDAAERSLGMLGAVRELRIAATLRARTAPPSGLSAREVEVLRLVAAGRSNREVADRLVISEKTVARHLANIFMKLDVASRTEAAAVAFDLGIRADGR
jgi:DNA-binding NarL/FixJ family response regulator